MGYFSNNMFYESFFSQIIQIKVVSESSSGTYYATTCAYV